MTIVCKLGGSLLNLPDLSERLNEALKQRSSENCLIIPGGGATADLVREWSRIHGLSDEVAHWMALSSLDFNSRLLKQLMRWESVSSRRDADANWNRQSLPLLLEIERFFRAEESQIVSGADHEIPDPGSRVLPHHWDVTSDSLAAWTAIRWPASELILFKSVPAPIGLSAAEASAASMVDCHFPDIANHVSQVSWCNLRNAPALIETWLHCCTSVDGSSPQAANDSDH